MPRVDRLEGGLLSTSQQDPVLSGNGEKLALIVDQNGRPTVQLRDLRTRKVIPLRFLSRHQPHSSPSLSWNGRYLAVITQRKNLRLAVIEDRLSGKIHQLSLPRERVPIRLSLSPDGGQLAMQFAEQGKWRIELFDLRGRVELDEPAGTLRSFAREGL